MVIVAVVVDHNVKKKKQYEIILQVVALFQFLSSFEKLRKRILAISHLHVRLSGRMEQLGSSWTDFHEI
jgi:hypothetical protein